MDTRELIESAFAEVAYPGDDNIAHHQCLECDDVRAYFRGKSWRDLTFPELRGFGQSLNLLTPEVFLYFLPGYMTATLKNWNEADMIPYSIITIGGYRDDAWNVKEEARENRKMFSPKQREAIAAWLQELSQDGPREWRGDEDIVFAIKQILEN